MPASSLGASNSWGVYLLASAALLLLLTPQLAAVAKDSRESADWRNLDGVRAAVDSLRPGIALVFSYGLVKVSDPLRLMGHLVTCYDGNETLSATVRWMLPNATLLPSVRYGLSLAQGGVVVVQDV